MDNGETLINCLAYIDLNPVRAGIVEKPEDYRWSSLGYHVQTNNKDNFLSLDLGLREFGPSGIRGAPVKSASLSQVNLTGQAVTSEFHPDGITTSRTFHWTGGAGSSESDRLSIYRRFVYGKGCLDAGRQGKSEDRCQISDGENIGIQEKKEKGRRDFELTRTERFKYRSRYFTDSGIIGTKAFVAKHYQTFKHYFASKYEKKPKTIKGLNGIYSFKRLSEKD